MNGPEERSIPKENQQLRTPVTLPPNKRADGLAKAWEELSNSGVSAEGLALVAGQLKTRLAESQLRSSPASFQLYSLADSKSLRALEDALQSNSAPPEWAKYDARISDDIKAREERFHTHGVGGASACTPIGNRPGCLAAPMQ
jgi:hypothetical protein